MYNAYWRSILYIIRLWGIKSCDFFGRYTSTKTFTVTILSALLYYNACKYMSIIKNSNDVWYLTIYDKALLSPSEVRKSH